MADDKDIMPAQVPDRHMRVSFSMLAGRGFPPDFVGSCEFAALGSVTWAITMPSPNPNATNDQQYIAVMSAKGGGNYVMQVNSVEGHMSMSMTYVADTNALAEQLIHVGVPEELMPKLGLADVRQAKSEARGALGRMMRGPPASGGAAPT